MFFHNDHSIVVKVNRLKKKKRNSNQITLLIHHISILIILIIIRLISYGGGKTTRLKLVCFNKRFSTLTKAGGSEIDLQLVYDFNIKRYIRWNLIVYVLTMW